MILTLLIALGSLAAARTLGTTLRGKFEELNAQLQDIRLP
jgi:Flp pilus assembly pilin Flp